jgi:ketosteroid isomerase-like protein
MSIESNKELVENFWSAFAKGDIKGAFAHLSDEISWLIPGNLPNLSGLRKGKARFLTSHAKPQRCFPLD